MNAVGVVAEYNPFHRGHAYHLAQVRRAYPGAAVVVCMSGHWVQRGDCAVADKWRRARWAVRGGADLVLELPTPFALRSAEGFARGAVAILAAAGCGALSFGSESGDARGLLALARRLESDAFSQALRPYLDRGLPFAACRQRAARDLLGDKAELLAGPNDSLACEYLKAALHLNWRPRILPVRRRGAGHDGGDHPVYPSASRLRREIAEGRLPLPRPAFLETGDRAILSRLRAMDPGGFAALPDAGEGLDRRLCAAVRQGASFREVCALAQTKRYAQSRVRRVLLWGALGLTGEDLEPAPTYLRVLALNGRGAAHLAGLRGGALPIITKPAQHRESLAREARCSDLYALCLEEPWQMGEEFRRSPGFVPLQNV